MFPSLRMIYVLCNIDVNFAITNSQVLFFGQHSHLFLMSSIATCHACLSFLTFVTIQEKLGKCRVKVFRRIGSSSGVERALNAMTMIMALSFVQTSSWNSDSRRSRMRSARGWRWSATRFVSWGSPVAGSGGPNYSCSAKGAANAVGSGLSGLISPEPLSLSTSIRVTSLPWGNR